MIGPRQGIFFGIFHKMHYPGCESTGMWIWVVRKPMYKQYELVHADIRT